MKMMMKRIVLTVMVVFFLSLTASALFPDDGPATYLLARCRRAMAEPEADIDPAVVRMDAK